MGKKLPWRQYTVEVVVRTTARVRVDVRAQTWDGACREAENEVCRYDFDPERLKVVDDLTRDDKETITFEPIYVEKIGGK